ncbi:MAG: hypothetical protein QM804_06490 [Propionicimonas sp.]
MADELISTWQDAELCVAGWMRLMGHSDARPTLSPADGLDVRSQTAVAQVRWRVVPASLVELRQFYESVADPQLDLYHFSRAGYTDDAVEWASQVGMAVFQLSPDRTIEPLNQPAQVALQAVPPGATPTWLPITAYPSYQPGPPVARPYLPVPAPYRLPALGQPAWRLAQPRHPGRAQRGWGIGLMVFGYLPASLLLLMMVLVPGAPAGILAAVGFYLGFGAVGTALYRAGARKRNQQRSIQPPRH